MGDSILVLGDTHFPFDRQDSVDRVVDLLSSRRDIGTVIQVGDLYDFYSFSKYPRNHNVVLPETELFAGRLDAVRMWGRIRGVARDRKRGLRCLQMYGNHDQRAVKRAAELAPAFGGIIQDWLKKQLSFSGVELVSDAEHIIEHPKHGMIMFMHGFRKHGEHARYNQMNTVVGHLHTGGVSYFTKMSGAYWELNAGWLGDKNREPFSYMAQKKLSGTTVGVGLIDDLGPRFVSFE